MNKPKQKKIKYYVHTTINKLPSVDFFPKFAFLLSFSQTESAFFTKFNKLSTMLHFLFLLMLFRNLADT